MGGERTVGASLQEFLYVKDQQWDCKEMLIFVLCSVC
jgi:hypothetical protein